MLFKEFRFIVLSIICLITTVENREVKYQEVYKIAEKWANDIGQALWKISETVTRRHDVINSFKMTFVAEENGFEILENVSDTLKLMMDKKVAAVKRIVRHAEELAARRKPDIFPNSTYDYFDSNNVSETEFNKIADKDLDDYLEKREQLWKFEEEYYKHGSFVDKLKIHKSKVETNKKNVAGYTNVSYIARKPGAFRYMPLEDHEHFKTQVNINFSSVRAAVNLYGREKQMLNDIRWSEALDTTFKENFRKDPSLTWQYFASSDGFMRLYPAIKWSEERYDQTYEYRIKSWYTDALTSPKDVVILVDISGSMRAHNRREISRHIVNEILDTLNDNDFVNIYTFNNLSNSLVDCFGDNLVQANEENLRLLRESLAVYKVRFPGDMSLGFKKAFKLLQRYRESKGAGAQCNQAIMIITEGLDYDYHAELFKLYNRPSEYYRPVRVFTYQLGTEPNDGMHMEWIACANMGYYVNISTIEEVHEKVIKYLSVMSRPVNMNCEKREIPHKGISCDRPDPLWSALYVDLADRKLSNWLWNKFEGNRQRDAFINFAKEESVRLKMIFKDNTHFMQQITHEYEKYRIPRNYSHLTTVSLPVLDLRPNSTNVLGVAAVDVSREYIKSLITCYRLGANGYTFILTNNGYLLFHPDHRTDFQNILKPTFNRVDMTEVEILDDLNEPRLFGEAIVELRKNIVLQKEGYKKLKVKSHIDDMKRLFLDTRHYYHTKLGGPLSIVLALPDKYGLNTVRHKPVDDFMVILRDTLGNIMESQFWKIHPEWLYCKYYGLQKKFYSLEEELRYYLQDIVTGASTEKIKQCDRKLVQAFVKDFNVTNWFDDDLRHNSTIKKIVNDFKVTLVFMATHTGLTRWQNTQYSGKDEAEYMSSNNEAIDEVWYRRAVEMNYYETKFVYSVPFHEYLDYNVSKTLVTASHTIFKEDDMKKAPAATVAYKFFQTTLYELFLAVTSSTSVYQCGNQLCNLTCGKDILCYIIDNNGYVIVSNKARDVGKFLANIKVDIITDVVENLVNDGVYKRTRFFDYQAICFYDPKTESPGTKINSLLSNLIGFFQWIIMTFFYYFQIVYGDREYKNFTEKTVLYEKYEIAKSVPTPCDKEMWLYNLNQNTFTQNQQEQQHKYQEHNNKTLGCTWSYVVHQIPSSNLLFLVVNEQCKKKSTNVNYKYTPKPVEITYGNMSLPCYIAVQNNYTRKNYIKCFKRSEKEDKLNLLDKRYCADYEEDKELRLRIY